MYLMRLSSLKMFSVISLLSINVSQRLPAIGRDIWACKSGILM
jgi:hypothetical protein